MPKFRKPRLDLIDQKNRRKVDFKVDYSSLLDPGPSNVFTIKNQFQKKLGKSSHLLGKFLINHPAVQELLKIRMRYGHQHPLA
jgi:hypothetical protein